MIAIIFFTQFTVLLPRSCIDSIDHIDTVSLLVRTQLCIRLRFISDLGWRVRRHRRPVIILKALDHESVCFQVRLPERDTTSRWLCLLVHQRQLQTWKLDSRSVSTKFPVSWVNAVQNGLSNIYITYDSIDFDIYIFPPLLSMSSPSDNNRSGRRVTLPPIRDLFRGVGLLYQWTCPGTDTQQMNFCVLPPATLPRRH